MERLLGGHDPSLTVPQFLAMRAIATGGVTGSELAQRTGVSGPAISQLRAGLAGAGLIERHELVEDRRRQTLSLSATGEYALASAQMLLDERLSALLADLPRPEADALARALPHVEATLSGAPPPRRPPQHPPPGPRHRPRGRLPL
jgi:DNA-binding MarR family transcriptional regulator